MKLLSSFLELGGREVVGEGLEVAQQLLEVEERVGNFPSTLAQDPGSEDSWDTWKIAGHDA